MPSSARQKVVLVLDDGPMTRNVLDAFHRQGLKFFYLDYLQLVEQGRVHLETGDSSEIALGGARLRLRDVAAVIGRGPLPIRMAQRHRDHERAIFWDRWTQLLLDLRGVLAPEVIWLPSHPLNGHPEWQNKFSELRVARRCGLCVPETICTNDPEVARAFMKRYRASVLLKDASLAGRAFSVTRIRSGEKFRGLQQSPTVLQQSIDKAYDIRAVFVGDTVLAARIDSQASPSARLDWRVYDDARVKWERTNLPPATKRGAFRLLRALDLTWASIDFAVDRDEKHYFLEANRPGACFWLLPYAGLDVAAQIAAYLKRVL
ncbi:MAG: hypothetical protein U0174_17460 [Polyangiaceae bacterium]